MFCIWYAEWRRSWMRGCGAVDGDRGLGRASSAGHRRGREMGDEAVTREEGPALFGGLVPHSTDLALQAPLEQVLNRRIKHPCQVEQDDDVPESLGQRGSKPVA